MSAAVFKLPRMNLVPGIIFRKRRGSYVNINRCKTGESKSWINTYHTMHRYIIEMFGDRGMALALNGARLLKNVIHAHKPGLSLGCDEETFTRRLRCDPEGIKHIWSRSLGPGCSSVTIVNGKLYTMGNSEDRDIVFCLDPATGETIWTFEYACELMANHYEGGPNSTPTVVDGRVFTLSRKGQIFCLDAQTGENIWEASMGV